MEHEYFGSLSESTGQLHWERRVELAGRPTSLEMTTDADVIPAHLDTAAKFTRELARYDAAARLALLRDHAEGTTMRLYVDHHMSELPKAILDSLFPNAGSPITPQQFLAKMVLKRVGLHPGDNCTAIFDYSLDENATDYLLVVGFSADGEIESINMES